MTSHRPVKPASLWRPLVLAAGLLLASAGMAQTRVIILGTGTPDPVLNRAGPGVAIITGGEAYLFDAGGGMVKRAAQAYLSMHAPELNPETVDHLFITHLHSDHIHDIPELAASRWWLREQGLNIRGPEGLAAYVDNMNRMAELEAVTRMRGTPEALIVNPRGYQAVAHEITDGIVFSNDNISVEAFTVPHGDIRPAFGYKILTADKTIVISGDTAYSELLAEKAQGADILIHEVISGDKLAERNEFWQEYHNSSHTTTYKLAEIANMARPELLVMTHLIFYGATEEELLKEVTDRYDGRVVLADDLDEF